MDLEVPLNRLMFGHEDGAGINARVTGRQDGIAELAANLHARGQIENLVVKAARVDEVTGHELFSVSNGNRRLAAFHMIYGPDSVQPIRCTLRDVDEDGAFEDSLTTAVTAKQLHPVDQYEAFARLEEHGKTNEEIAHQYGMTEKEVRQALALGRLSPKIREAWRSGEIAAGIAQAFTLALEHNTQDRLFERLEKAGHMTAAQVRRELGASDADVAQLINFVGADFYRECGGEVVEDLFGSAHIVSDVPKLKQIAADKLTTACEQLRGEGWSWADPLEALPSAARYWRTSDPKALSYEGDEAERAKAFAAAIKANLDEDGDPVDYELADKLDGDLAAFEQAVLRRSFTKAQKSKSGCIV